MMRRTLLSGLAMLNGMALLKDKDATKVGVLADTVRARVAALAAEIERESALQVLPLRPLVAVHLANVSRRFAKPACRLLRRAWSSTTASSCLCAL